MDVNSVTNVFDGNVVAVKDFSLSVVDEEFVVLVGPSGCGKSTTLRMIAGLEETTAGTIRIGDRVVNDVPPKDRDIAMVFQNYALYPHKTVYENMAFGLRLRRFPKSEIDQRVQEAARVLGISEYLGRKPKALSGGQRQRVALGRAIVRKPACFLLDEPLSNLDAKLRVGMRAELNRLHNQLETTMVYVTHDQVEAMTLGDRIVVMKDGLIQQVGDPLTIYDNPRNRFVAGFIGTPPMNFLAGTVVGSNGKLVFREGDTGIPVPDRLTEALGAYRDKSVVLGVRPEDIHDRPHQDITDTFQMPMKVDVVELLGDDMLLYLSTAGNELISKVDSHPGIEHGQDLKVTLDMSKVHFFDPETGENVCLTDAQSH
jgi:multiple sugar transport system ATP-binding protein